MDTYVTHEDINIISNTSLQGYIQTTYTELILAFGLPITKNNDYKTDAEWFILYNKSITTTLYNYKNGKKYNGRSGTPIKEIKTWNIGGFSPESKKLIEDTISNLYLLYNIEVSSAAELKIINKRLKILGFKKHFQRNVPYPFNIIISYNKKYKINSYTINYNNLIAPILSLEYLLTLEYDQLIFESIL